MIGSPLLSATPPWILAANFESPVFEAVLEELRAAGGEVISLDGALAPTEASLFDQFAESAKLPDYFGRNWPALDECLADLEWLPATLYVVTLKNPERLLEDERLSRPVFVRMINGVAEEWAEVIADGEYWDRPSMPFHLIADVRAAPSSGDGFHFVGENSSLAWLGG